MWKFSNSFKPSILMLNLMELGKSQLHHFILYKLQDDVLQIGISRGSGQTPRVTGTGAGRPGNTPDPCIPDPCIPESVTRPVHTRHAGGCVLYNLAGCTTPTTPPLWRGQQP